MECADCGGFTKGRSNLIKKFGRPPLCHPCGNKRGIEGREKSNSYGAVHQWMHKTFGPAMKCEHCGKERKKGEKGSVVEWANRTRGYKRERSDWLELCVKCHAKYDGITITNRPHSYAKYQTEKCRCEICRADYMAHKKTWPSTEYWSRADIRKRQREARAKKSPKP